MPQRVSEAHVSFFICCRRRYYPAPHLHIIILALLLFIRSGVHHCGRPSLAVPICRPAASRLLLQQQAEQLIAAVAAGPRRCQRARRARLPACLLRRRAAGRGLAGRGAAGCGGCRLGVRRSIAGGGGGASRLAHVALELHGEQQTRFFRPQWRPCEDDMACWEQSAAAGRAHGTRWSSPAAALHVPPKNPAHGQ